MMTVDELICVYRGNVEYNREEWVGVMELDKSMVSVYVSVCLSVFSQLS